jgi:hypothetical protein
MVKVAKRRQRPVGTSRVCHHDEKFREDGYLLMEKDLTCEQWLENGVR